MANTANAHWRSNIVVPTAESVKDSSNDTTKANGKTALADKLAHERNVKEVALGDLLFDTWYPSWFPDEVIPDKQRGKGIVQTTMYVCKWCFAYHRDPEIWAQHYSNCPRATSGPPGTHIYHHGSSDTLSIWEVEGEVEHVFCQNLSLFAKFFLDNKSVLYDVNDFHYFLLVHTKPDGVKQIIGFFSKEKQSWDRNNLACILVFPPWQRKGLGSLLIAVSYEIGRREDALVGRVDPVSGPEKPISNLGKKSYERYWSAEIARYLLNIEETDCKNNTGFITVEMISRETWIAPDDCLAVLREMGGVERVLKGKGKKGKAVKADKQEEPVEQLDKGFIREWVNRQGLDSYPSVDVDGFVGRYRSQETIEGVEVAA
ncbi:histone acetyltransferase [Calycina marina]|uniref:histone acetyltransferase n=1 Tax=Calycina marina TaxID=1763456 RepID=A0A9P8CE16_9HELO|nr:histone acetyltransferase [Calycina marina]